MNAKTKVEFAVEVDGKVLPAENREHARTAKRTFAANGLKAKIIRNEYQLINTKVVR